eukprot:12312049-Ditylum_brightwellii.AAC.1
MPYDMVNKSGGKGFQQGVRARACETRGADMGSSGIRHEGAMSARQDKLLAKEGLAGESKVRERNRELGSMRCELPSAFVKCKAA